MVKGVMKRSRYLKYKLAGADWIDEIPEEWKEGKLKFFSDIVLGKMLAQEDKGDYFLKPYLRAKNIDWLTIDVNDVNYMWFSERELTIYWLEKDDLLVSEGGEVGRTAIWNNELDECYIQNSVSRVRLNAQYSPRYFLYQFYAAGRMGYFDSIVNRVSIAHLTKEKLGGVAFVVPSYAEQKAIADFLDRETAVIDTLIAKKQELIQRLHEKRTALISHTVTKGLDPTVPMKDSGVEWMGAIPAHWELSRSKWLFTVRTERAHPDDIQLSATQAYGVISQEEFMRKVGRRVTQITQHLDQRRHVEIDDFVISMRSFEGGLERAWETGCIRSSYVVLRPSPQTVVDFFTYLFKSSPYIQALRATSNFLRDGQDLNFNNFSLVDLPVIPQSEQKGISAFLDGQTQKIDALVEKSNRFIALLEEYRTTLISAAVTGNIDVRARGPGRF